MDELCSWLDIDDEVRVDTFDDNSLNISIMSSCSLICLLILKYHKTYGRKISETTIPKMIPKSIYRSNNPYIERCYIVHNFII